MPVEFIQQSQPAGSSSSDLFRLTMSYDGSGRRISKTSMRKVVGNADWDTAQVTHYTGIGTEIREIFTGPAAETKVVVNMPNGLGRYGIEDAVQSAESNASQKFEWYLKNHLGSTMLVYGTVTSTDPTMVDIGARIAAYDYHAFGEMVELTPPPTDKVTENFTGKEHDDEIALDYFGVRYLDPMLGMWTSVDPARQFASPYLYAGNGYNPVNGVDPDGNVISILLSNELAGKNSYVNKYTADEVALGQSREPQVVPLYKMYVRNSSGSSAVFPVTRDAVAGKGPFNTNGSYGGNIRSDGKMGFRIELTDLETGAPTIVDQNKIKRSNVQIHIGPGCSKGCSLLQGGGKGRANFESTIENMIQEDVDNNKGSDIYVDTEKFIPFDAQ